MGSRAAGCAAYWDRAEDDHVLAARSFLTDEERMSGTSCCELSSELTRVMRGYRDLRISLANASSYRRFRSVEPSLVSCLDGQVGEERREPDVLMVLVRNEPAGILSFVIETNPRKAGSADRYARIDLVIVARRFRGLGLSRLLILAVLVHLLREHGRRLYSISCLAAHEAIAHVLEEIGFVGQTRDGKGFRHEELRVDGPEADALGESFARQLRDAAQVTGFRLRQSERKD